MSLGFFLITTLQSTTQYLKSDTPYYATDEIKANDALTPIESFIFNRLGSAITNTICAPFYRLRSIIQLKRTIIECNVSTTIPNECLSNPSIFTIITTEGFLSLYNGNLYSALRVFGQNTLHLIIKKKIRDRFFPYKPTDPYYMLVFKVFLSGYLGNIIAANFTHYLLLNAFKSRLSIISTNDYKYRFGIFQSQFASSCTVSFVYRACWFITKYGIEPNIRVLRHNYWIKKIIRKFIYAVLPRPLDTIRNRQIMTNETMYTAARNLYRNHGWRAFYDGICTELVDEFMRVGLRELRMCLKWHYADRRYDISETQRRRTAVINLCKLCRFRDELLYREGLLVRGYVHQFMEQTGVFIPDSLIEFIEIRCIHDDKLEIDDEDVAEIMDVLCNLNMNDNESVDGVIIEENAENLELLLKDKCFQWIWKQRMKPLIIRYFDEKDDNDHESISIPQSTVYLDYLDRWIDIEYFCDVCEEKVENKTVCDFWECGHSFCGDCMHRITQFNDDKCLVCFAEIDCDLKCQSSIILRDFDQNL